MALGDEALQEQSQRRRGLAERSLGRGAAQGAALSQQLVQTGEEIATTRTRRGGCLCPSTYFPD